MNITQYVRRQDNEFRFSEQQGSDFAKSVADDFNPIHDVGSKRFCVPGDLLFSVVLHRYGVHATTHVQFAGMLPADVPLVLPERFVSPLHAADARGRNCLTVFAKGEANHDEAFIAALAVAYVQFSGKTFPDILVGLMRDAGKMINPQRPLVIYRDMALEVDRFGGTDISLELASADLAMAGKKGLARLQFTILAAGEPIGRGEKNLVLSGLREFDEAAMDAVVSDYNQRRIDHQSALPGVTMVPSTGSA